MATAKKLPSGSWRCLVYDYTDENGKRIYKSFTSSNPTAKGKREAEYMAAEYAAKKRETSQNKYPTFGEALQAYIADREPVLSPATIREYRRNIKNYDDIKDINLDKLDQEQIQAI